MITPLPGPPPGGDRGGARAMTPACFGVVCPLRARCVRYAAVGMSDADPATLLTCVDQGRFPLFVARRHPAASPPGPPGHPAQLHLVDE